MQRTTYLLTLSVLALLPFCHRARAGAPIRTVAVTGDAAPGTAGGVFGDIYWGPVINENGQVAFQAELQSGIGGVSQTDDMGIWSEGPGTLSLVAREGDQAPGAPSQTFFADIHNSGLGVLDDSGRLAYNAPVTGERMGLWVHDQTSSSLVALTGDQAPELPAGAKVETFAFSNRPIPAANGTGQVAFGAYLEEGSGGVDSSNNMAIWSGPPDDLHLVARRGDPALGLPSPYKFDWLTNPSLNGNGRVAFFAGITTGGSPSPPYESGIWFGAAENPSLLVRTGDQAPGTPTGAHFDGVYFPSISDSGHVVFWASLQEGPGGVNDDNYRGIWMAEPDGSVRLVAREGDIAPGVPNQGRFLEFGDATGPVISSVGRVALRGVVEPDPSQPALGAREGIWITKDDGQLRLVALEGQEVPGLGGNAVLGGEMYRVFSNAKGQVGFTGRVLQGDETWHALFATDPDGDLALVVREGAV